MPVQNAQQGGTPNVGRKCPCLRNTAQGDALFAIEQVKDLGYSRLPVYEDDIDHIVGVLYAKDLLKLDPESDRDRPIQIIFAGKAHPADTMAKEIIRELVHFMRDPAIRRRIVFIENYDINGTAV